MALSDAEVSTGFRGSFNVSRHGEGAIHGPLSRAQRIREAATLCFSETNLWPFACDLAAGDWKSLVHWLDASGLALYFLERSTEIGERNSLPALVVNGLERRLEENYQRTRGLFDESVKLQRDFESVNLSYAVMKGISLYPASVPRPELRHQFDLDFLVSESDAPVARGILERQGYRLFAISGKSWEFKKGQTPLVTAKDLYRDLPYRGVELHLETNTHGGSKRLRRIMQREIRGVMMPVLSPVDIFLGQAMHASKDVSGPFVRASHFLEFYRHAITRRDDSHFWEELRERASEDQRTCLALGIVTYLATSVWGDFAPRTFTSWTVERIPPPIKLWLDLYGRSAIFQAPPGNKRFLRLRQEIERAHGRHDESSKLSFLSFGFPRAVIQATPGENLQTRFARYCLQVRFLASRSRFHLIEGLRFVCETPRWRRLRSSLP